MRKKYRKNMIAFPLIFIIIGLLILRHLFTNQGDISIHVKDNYSHACHVNDLIVYLDSDGIYCKNSKGNIDKICNISIAKTSTVTADEEFIFFSPSVDSKKIFQLDYFGNVIKIHNISHSIYDMYFVDDILYVLNYSDINMRYDIKAYSSVDDMKIIDLDKCPYDYNITVEKNFFSANIQIINNRNHCYLKITDKNEKTVFCNVYNKKNAKQIFLSKTDMTASLYDNKLILFPLKSGKLNNYYIINIDNGKVVESGTTFNIDYSYQPIKQSDKYLIIIAQYSHYAKGFTDNVSEQIDGDRIILWNYETSHFEEKKTKKHERIIYANSQKAITYYKGKYLTYSLEDWSLIKKQSVDEIKEGGSYTFESCGDYIFVFDNNSGELLNTINIA